jgi:hypothetical protein
MSFISIFKLLSADSQPSWSRPAYFPRLDFINSQGTSASLQFLQGCSSITLQRIRRELQILQAFFACSRTRVVPPGVSGFADDMFVDSRIYGRTIRSNAAVQLVQVLYANSSRQSPAIECMLRIMHPWRYTSRICCG